MATHEQVLFSPARLAVLEETQRLVLWNDDVNTFEWVIECLMELCQHTAEQAEQCAWFVHFKGKYAVKHGSFQDLRPVCEALLDRGLSATVE
jgi:ATP-dependent Clp protease adaptor protein ClpS